MVPDSGHTHPALLHITKSAHCFRTRQGNTIAPCEQQVIIMSEARKPTSMIGRFWNALHREPLIPFALIGGLLFVAYGFGKPTPVEVIEITPQTIQTLVDSAETMRGRAVTDEERKVMIDSHIEDEVLLREAMRRGLEKKDSRVRKRLLTVMRSTLDEQVPEPTRAELQAYFRENADEYAASEAVTFDQVFFSFGNEPADSDALLGQLKGDADFRKMGERSWAGYTMRKMTRQEMLPVFGGDFADQVLGLTPKEWAGPQESVRGVHFLRVTERYQLPAPTFDQMEDNLRQDWMFNRRRAVQTKKIEDMKMRYCVVLTKE